MSKKIGIKKCYLFVLMMILLCIMNLNTKAGDDITVSVSSSEAIIGNEVEVVLNISNGLDIGAYEFTISYDKNIFDYIECVTALNTMAMSAIESENGIHISAILNEDINSKEAKEVLKIKFKVKNNVEKGKYPISILEGFIVDKHTGEGILFNTVDGNISVGNEILGDVDGNGKVNIADAMIVFRIVAGKTVDTAYDVDNLGDVNSDSTINIVDAMMLFHFVSDRIDEFVETGKNNTDGEIENTETEELTSEKETTKEITEEETTVEVQITTEEQATTEEQTTTEKQTTTKNETDKETTENKEEYTTEKETTRSEESTTENIIIDVTDITLSKTELSLKKGAFTSLEVYVYPDNASDKTVVWSSSNTAVVSVNSYGKVTAIGNGTAIITAKSNSGGAVASCKVTVTTPVTSINLDKTSVSLNQGETVTLIATLNPIGASNKEVLWDSSNASVATVDKSGKVVAVGNGTAIITVTTVDGGKVAECKVTVNTPVTGVNIDVDSIAMIKNGSYSLNAIVSPTNASNKTLTWSSSNTSVATVNSQGVVTAKGNGTAIITVTSNDGKKTDTCTVVVKTSAYGISLNKTNMTLNKGATATLVATITPKDASDKSIVWTSSNTSVATVDSTGKVTAKGNGTASIVAKLKESGISVACNVTVVTPVTGVTLNKTSVALNKGGTVTLVATVNPTGASNKTVTWVSSNTSIATVNSAGKVTAVGDGIVYITAKTQDGGKTATCTVHVTTPVTGVTLNKTSIALDKGETVTLVATVNPTGASNKTVTWVSSNTSIATVNSAGKVTAVGNGIVYITAKTQDGGKTATCTVHVTTPVTEVTLNKTSATLNNGGTVTLVATVNPTGASNKTVTWSSSNTAVATVNSSGKVTAVGNGTAQITVKTQDRGKTAICTVTVVTPVTGVTLNKTSVTLNNGGTVTLIATVNPTVASNKTVTWSSSNTAVATVTNAGKITAKGNGTTTITVKTQDGSKTATCKVTVTTPVTGISITNKTDVMLDIKGTYQCKTSIAPTTASNKNVTWSSSDSTIAKVDSNGKITGLKPGIATITVKTADGGYTDSVKVYVYKTNAQIPAGGNTWYRISIASTTNRVMEVNNGSTFNGAKVQLNSSNGSIAQLWQFHDYISTNGGVAIVPKCNSNGYILDVNRGTSYSTPFAENNLIDVWMIGEDNAASMWQLVKLWDGSYIFKLINTDWVAGVTSTAAGAQLMLRKFDLTDMNQRWFLEAVTESDEVASPAIEAAINWAYQKMNSNDMSYCYWCLRFVGDAFRNGGIENAGYNTATQAGNALITSTSTNPPRGTVVFWDWYGTIDGVYANYGHVGISLGNGQVIHADYNGIKITGLDLGAGRPYRGWGQWK